MASTLCKRMKNPLRIKQTTTITNQKQKNMKQITAYDDKMIIFFCCFSFFSFLVLLHRLSHNSIEWIFVFGKFLLSWNVEFIFNRSQQEDEIMPVIGFSCMTLAVSLPFQFWMREKQDFAPKAYFENYYFFAFFYSRAQKINGKEQRNKKQAKKIECKKQSVNYKIKLKTNKKRRQKNTKVIQMK